MWIGALLAVCSLATFVGVPPVVTDTTPMPFIAVSLFMVISIGFFMSMRNDRRTYEQAYIYFEVQRALTQDRFDIARDLHDIISDGLALIHLRASVARQIHASDPDQALLALSDIEQASRTTIKELRELLLVLRGDPTHQPESDRNRSLDFRGFQDNPTPSATNTGHRGSEQFSAVLARARQASLVVTVSPDEVAPLIDQLPQSHQVVLIGALREALGNAARYAGPTGVEVTVEMDTNHVHMSVLDEGKVNGWEPTPGSGMGLGMVGQSVSALGGLITTQPRVDQAGFLVSVSLPLPESAHTQEVKDV